VRNLNEKTCAESEQGLESLCYGIQACDFRISAALPKVRVLQYHNTRSRIKPPPGFLPGRFPRSAVVCAWTVLKSSPLPPASNARLMPEAEPWGRVRNTSGGVLPCCTLSAESVEGGRGVCSSWVVFPSFLPSSADPSVAPPHPQETPTVFQKGRGFGREVCA